MTALLAAEFGGRRIAQLMAAGATAACPAFMGASIFFGTTLIDQLAWVSVLMLVARALRLGTTPAWLLAGAAAGVGLENKHTVVVLLAGIAVGLAICRRETLRTAGPWLAAGLALLLAVPNLAWNATHGWPALRFAEAMSRRMGGALGSLGQLHLLAVLFAGPLLVLLWLFGVQWLASPAGRAHRWVLVTAAVAVAVFTATGGRPYYAAPVLAALFAAGAVRVEAAQLAAAPPRWLGYRTRPPLGWTVAIAVSFVGAALACLPVLPLSAASALRPVNPIPTETYGWAQLTNQVAGAVSALPAEATVFTSNYGEASALAILGPAAHLHRAVYSGDNNYALWGPPSGRPDTVVCVGRFTLGYLHRHWSQVTPLATVGPLRDVHNSETGARVYLCQRPRGSWAEMWPSLRHFN